MVYSGISYFFEVVWKPIFKLQLRYPICLRFIIFAIYLLVATVAFPFTCNTATSMGEVWKRNVIQMHVLFKIEPILKSIEELIRVITLFTNLKYKVLNP